MKENKEGLSVSLDGSQLVLMEDIEFNFGPCSEELSVIDNQFIARIVERIFIQIGSTHDFQGLIVDRLSLSSLESSPKFGYVVINLL